MRNAVVGQRTTLAPAALKTECFVESGGGAMGGQNQAI